MTPQPCTKRQNGQKGMIIPILPSLVQAVNLQHHQDSLIHVTNASSHGVANRQTRSLSSLLPSISHSSSNQTRMYENSLGSATSADVQATKRWSASLSCSKLAEVSLCKASLHNPLTGWDQDHIIRETSERTTREE